MQLLPNSVLTVYTPAPKTRTTPLPPTRDQEHICMCIYLSIYLSTYLSIYLPIYLSICLSIYLSIYLPIYLSIYIYIYVYIYIYIYVYLVVYNSLPKLLKALSQNLVLKHCRWNVCRCIMGSSAPTALSFGFRFWGLGVQGLGVWGLIPE